MKAAILIVIAKSKLTVGIENGKIKRRARSYISN